jgi:hypothetical protein
MIFNILILDKNIKVIAIPCPDDTFSLQYIVPAIPCRRDTLSIVRRYSVRRCFGGDTLS